MRTQIRMRMQIRHTSKDTDANTDTGYRYGHKCSYNYKVRNIYDVWNIICCFECRFHLRFIMHLVRRKGRTPALWALATIYKDHMKQL